MKELLRPGMIIYVLGFCGLVFVLAQSPSEIGSKIPISLFFLFIITIGVIIDIKQKELSEQVFGEMESNGGFG